MDIHVQVYAVKSKQDSDGNVGVQFNEVGTRSRIVVHMSKATAIALMKDLDKLLEEKSE